MAGLYHKDGIIGRLFSFFSQIFGKVSAPTLQHYFELCLSVLALNGFQSVKGSYEHFIQEISHRQLNSFYYALNESKMNMDSWMNNLLTLVLQTLPVVEESAIILSLDDTMVEKYGEHFACRSTLFAHAAHNGSACLDGHCFVCLMLSVPVWDKDTVRYIHIPVSCRMWTKETSKLEMAAQLIRQAMKVTDPQQTVCLCCDSWYPKGSVTELVNEFSNLDIICNVRSDTVLYALPPERTGKRGRPRERGERLNVDDFSFSDVQDTPFEVSYRYVLTNLFGKRKVLAIVTRKKEGKGKRVFLCTMPPEKIPFALTSLSGNAEAYIRSDAALLPLAYTFRWNMEVSFHEQKTFRALGDYRLRSQSGIERLMNLLAMVYTSMTLLPWWNPTFSDLKFLSPQQTRFIPGNAIKYQIFFSNFGSLPETLKNYPNLILPLEKLALSILPAA